MTTKYDTRESWLEAAKTALGGLVSDRTGMGIPAIQISPGWPSKGGPEGRVLGECWNGVFTRSGAYSIFMNPVVAAAEPVRILDIVLHEMLHAVVDEHHGKMCKHGREFAEAARAVGLDGAPTATFCTEGTGLWAELSAMADALGAYPGDSMEMTAAIKRALEKGIVIDKRGVVRKDDKKRRSGHWVKFASRTIDGYVVRVSPSNLREHGAPRDPKGDEMRCDDKRFDATGSPRPAEG